MTLDQIYAEVRKGIQKIEDPALRELCAGLLADLISARDEVERLRAVQKTLYSAGFRSGYEKGKQVGS